jgi:hypothetical protein
MRGFGGLRGGPGSSSPGAPPTGPGSDRRGSRGPGGA